MRGLLPWVDAVYPQQREWQVLRQRGLGWHGTLKAMEVM